MTPPVSLNALAVILAISSFVLAQPQPSRPAMPIEPISAIVQQFKSHPLVALGDNEGSVQGSEFRIKLIRDPHFVAVANDIVVEFGNSRYQDLVDRFTSGEEVSPESLRHVWQDTTQVEYTWDLPIYEQFFQAVRDINYSLKGSRKLRVLVGDPPIEWDNVHSLEDLKRWLNRDSFAAEVVRREVLAKGHRALIIYGDQHIAREASTSKPSGVGGIVAQLERTGISVFTVHTETRRDLSALQPDVASWPKPSLANLRDTVLGAATTDSRQQSSLADQFDAVLYLGPPGEMTLSKLSRALCSDPSYLEMRVSRLSLSFLRHRALPYRRRGCSRNTVSIPEAPLGSWTAILKQHNWSATPSQMPPEEKSIQTGSLLNHDSASSPFCAIMDHGFWHRTVHWKRCPC